MGKQTDNYDKLEQYDYVDDKYFDDNFEDIVDKYCHLIGLFLVNFSILEHDLNVAIAEIISHGSHEAGFVVIEKLSTSNKIELFYKMYIRLASFKDGKDKKVLKRICDRLKIINSFRNSVVHANWQSLTKNGYVRTKIQVDNQEGYVKFKKIKVTPKIIQQQIKDIDLLVEQINEYTEIAYQF